MSSVAREGALECLRNSDDVFRVISALAKRLQIHNRKPVLQTGAVGFMRQEGSNRVPEWDKSPHLFSNRQCYVTHS